MKSANILPFVMLALFQLSNAGTVVVREESGCELKDFVQCIVNLGELPLSITACSNAATDIGKIGSKDFNATETALEGADCLVEAAMEAVDLPEHCGGCLKGIISAVTGGGGD